MQALAFSALRPGAPRTSGVAESGVADVQVMALAAESREAAVELLYATYKGRIYSYLLRFTGDAHAADDLVQETFTKAFGAIRRLPRDAKVLPWLYRIASNAAIDASRRASRFIWLRVGKLSGTSDEPRAMDAQGAVSEREAIRDVLRTLPPENAMALLLHALEGYSYKEIAEIQGTSMTAVRSRIARARAAFKDRYVGGPST